MQFVARWQVTILFAIYSKEIRRNKFVLFKWIKWNKSKH